MTDPIGTAQERELINYLCRSTASPEEEQAADALQSRIAEVERLTGALREAWDTAHAVGFREGARAALNGKVQRVENVDEHIAALSQHGKL